MLQQEFEKLAGRKVDTKEFERINGVYLATTILDKNHFVDLYEKDKATLLDVFAGEMVRVDMALSERIEENKKLLDLIVSKGLVDMIEDVKRIVGFNRVLKAKLTTSSELTEEERQFLIDKF